MADNSIGGGNRPSLIEDDAWASGAQLTGGCVALGMELPDPPPPLPTPAPTAPTRWRIREKRVFWVRDVSYGEDRLHGRKIGLGLASLRSGAINIIRRLGHRYLPDGWRALFASPQLLAALTTPP